MNAIENSAHNFGFEIIKPHFAYLSPNKSRNYIVYDFTNKLTVLDAFKLNKINKSQLQDIAIKMQDLY